MKIIKKVGFISIVLISLIYLIIVVGPRIFNDFYPFGIKTAVVLTGSMAPTINIDDFVIMKKPDVITIGDVVSYRENDKDMEVLHRVTRISGDKITTKGDANNTEDKPIDLPQVTGVYIGKVENLGKILSFITKPLVFSAIITLLLALMFVPRKNIKDEGDKHEKQ